MWRSYSLPAAVGAAGTKTQRSRSQSGLHRTTAMTRPRHPAARIHGMDSRQIGSKHQIGDLLPPTAIEIAVGGIADPPADLVSDSLQADVEITEVAVLAEAEDAHGAGRGGAPSDT